MEIYATIVTVVAVVLLYLVLKWKIITKAITLFCRKKFREPTYVEIEFYIKEALLKCFGKE